MFLGYLTDVWLIYSIINIQKHRAKIRLIAGYILTKKLLKIPKCKTGYNCCGASVASEQQHKQDLRRIYKRENEFSKSSLFTRMLCGFLPECIAPRTTRGCDTVVTAFFLRGLQLRQVSGYGLL